jgi:hypothetical protein
MRAARGDGERRDDWERPSGAMEKATDERRTASLHVAIVS